MWKHGTKTTSFLPADGKGSCSLLASLVSLLLGGTVQLENTYSCILKVAGQVWESKKKKKGQASTLILATISTHLPKPVSTDLTIKSDSVLTNPLGTFNVTLSLEGWPLNALKRSYPKTYWSKEQKYTKENKTNGKTNFIL